ncbi:hypothetical protein GCM10010965_00350 [Caldalkalibacillus thermarum]|uniref:hypothetical protein n=1 Tax=Caldalkalibacillus thermarum TaxID=296745 RepID=UPI00166CCD02|nr:hypothetical protein [Caldalkalibacillus thermarum]GGK11399.1 hypothetical protein GCM10010965_00350 [Caldalkalibacillus thermarum]
MVISRKHLAKAKLEQLKNGYSAYTESTEVAFHLEREIKKHSLRVHIDRTPLGSWFIPIKDEE